MTLQKITPHIWFDKEAQDAAAFYVSVFGKFGKDSKIRNVTALHNTPSGSVDLVCVDILGQEFRLISAGPYFKINPSVSFLVACRTKDDVDVLWKKLSQGGVALMELGEYPFSEKYGWIQDQYGVSWQLMFIGARKITQNITPTMMFVGNVCGRAEEAINFYTSVFHGAHVGDIWRYGKGEEPEQEGTVKHAAFTLEGLEFAAMDSAQEHKFSFNEAVSFLVRCDTQEEIDYYWNKLSFDPAAERCGWLKDQFGFSWQVVPTAMEKILRDHDAQKVARVTDAFLKMKKFDLAKLNEVYNRK